MQLELFDPPKSCNRAQTRPAAFTERLRLVGSVMMAVKAAGCARQGYGADIAEALAANGWELPSRVCGKAFNPSATL